MYILSTPAKNLSLDFSSSCGTINTQRVSQNKAVHDPRLFFAFRFFIQKPSLARVAVFAFLYDDGNYIITDMYRESNTHSSHLLYEGVREPSTASYVVL